MSNPESGEPSLEGILEGCGLLGFLYIDVSVDIA